MFTFEDAKRIHAEVRKRGYKGTIDDIVDDIKRSVIYIPPSGPCTLDWCVVGTYEKLGSGVLGYYATRDMAEEAKEAINALGGHSCVEPFLGGNTR